MVKSVREDLSYKRIYKNLDLDKDLGIKWPVEKDEKETITVKVTKGLEPASYSPDEIDEIFCSEHGIDEEKFRAAFFRLDQSFDAFLVDKLRSIQPIHEKAFCEGCGYEGDETEDNQILICQGCGICVHQECYGVPEFAVNWLCLGCVNYFSEPSCEFCSMKKGILKRTDQNEFIHAVCASLNPTLTFFNQTFKDPVDTTNYQPIEGYCEICDEECDTLCECSFKGCPKAVHASCACGILYCDIANGKIYCQDHTPIFSDERVFSRKTIEKRQDGYSPLKHEIFEREDSPLQEIQDTEFMHVARNEPVVIKSIEGEELIEKYWKAKRAAYMTSFTDQFFLSNAFMKQQ